MLKHRVLKEPEMPEERLTASLPLCCPRTSSSWQNSSPGRQMIGSLRIGPFLLAPMWLRENHQKNCGFEMSKSSMVVSWFWAGLAAQTRTQLPLVNTPLQRDRRLHSEHQRLDTECFKKQKKMFALLQHHKSKVLFE